MRFARYWVYRETPVSRIDGSDRIFGAWGWSDRSADAAAHNAVSRARWIGSRILSGNPPDKYAYGLGGRPLREEILETVSAGDDAEPTMVVTRNSYGVAVLNAAHAMFVDLDAPPPPLKPARPVSFWTRVFARSGKQPAAGARATWEAETRRAVAEQLRRSGAEGARLYRTAGGLRLLFTDRLADPSDPEVDALMAALGADQLYRRLCRAQKSFRARLTPKPWRLPQGLAPFPGWPPGTPRAASRHAAWLEDYAAASAGFATCALLEGGAVHLPELEPIVTLHDQRTGIAAAAAGAPLA